MKKPSKRSQAKKVKKSAHPRPEVVIVCEGGLVQHVGCTVPFNYHVFDWDAVNENLDLDEAIEYAESAMIGMETFKKVAPGLAEELPQKLKDLREEREAQERRVREGDPFWDVPDLSQQKQKQK